MLAAAAASGAAGGHLESLVLFSCHLSAEGGGAAAAAISHEEERLAASHVADVQLVDCAGEEAAAFLAALLPRLPVLTALNVSSTSLEAAELPSALASCTRVTTLSLRECGMHSLPPAALPHSACRDGGSALRRQLPTASAS